MKVFLAIGLLAIGAHARSDDGFSSVSRTEDSLGNYQFQYDITDWDTNQRRWEQADAYNNRRGGYSITDIDGKVRHLEYVADKGGFRAVIRTNEPGTAPGYAGDALYIRDGVKEVLTAAQPALQFTGHVLKQKKLAGHAVAAVPAAVPVAKPVVFQQSAVAAPVVTAPAVAAAPVVAAPAVAAAPVVTAPAVATAPVVAAPAVKPVVFPQPTFVRPAAQVFQHVRPAVPVVAPRPAVVHQQHVLHAPAPLAVAKPVVYQQHQLHAPAALGVAVAPRPAVFHARPAVFHAQPAVFHARPAVAVAAPKPVVFQQQHLVPQLQRPLAVHVQQPAFHGPAVAPVVAAAPVVKPAVAVPAVAPAPVLVQKVVAPAVALKTKTVVVTPPPAYTGPRRRPQKFIEDPAQLYETPKVVLTPKRVPAYNPGQDDFEDDYGELSPPAALIVKSAFTRKSGKFPPLAGPPSRRASS